MKHVIIIGGGVAGLSAATALAEQNMRVTLYEKSKLLGGRTLSYPDPHSQEVVDNGQHLFLGCYVETQKMLKRIKAEHHVRFRDNFQTRMQGPVGAYAFLKTYALPAPFHLLWGYLQFKAFSLRERLGIFYLVLALKRFSPTELGRMSARHFLRKSRQSEAAQERFWDPLILATLNMQPEDVSAQMLGVVLEKGFMASRKDAASGLSDIGLTDLFGEHTKRFLIKPHIMQTSTRVQDLWIDKGKLKGVVIADRSKGEISVQADAVVCAVPPHATRKLIQKHMMFGSDARALLTLKPSPIVSLHVWTDQAWFNDPYVGFWGLPFDWAFRRALFMRDPKVSHYTLVASGARDMARLTTKDLIGKAKATLEPLWGGPVNILRAKKSVVHDATWTPPLGDARGRLPCRSGLNGFYFAGDWTDTGLPCTIESAIASGHKAAELICKSS